MPDRALGVRLAARAPKLEGRKRGRAALPAQPPTVVFLAGLFGFGLVISVAV